MVGAEHRADALGGQLEHPHVRRPGRFGVPQRGVQPGPVRVQFALAGRELQAQLRQVAVEPVQPRDEPARQQAAGATEHERRLGGLPLQLGAGAAQALEGVAGDIAQADTGIGEFYAASFLDQQGQPKLRFQLPNLPTDGAMGDMQLGGRLLQAAETRHGLEGAQGIERGKAGVHR